MGAPQGGLSCPAGNSPSAGAARRLRGCLRTSVDIGEWNLATYSYIDDGNYYLSSLDYGNGDSVEYEYDGLGRVTKQTYEDGDAVTYQYDNSGALATVTDSATGRKTTYYYDFTDRLMKYVETGTDHYHSVGYGYDTDNNLTSLVETINGTDYTTSYVYDDDNRVSSMLSGGNRVDYTYDEYGRLSTKITRQGTESTDPAFLTETYTYVGNTTDATTSTQIATYEVETASYSVTYTYTYDDNGNILSIHDGTYTTSYVYDSANQLIQENNARKNQTDTWTYDNAGNIQSHKTYAYTTDLITGTDVPTAADTYAYNDDKGWGDLLTAYNGTSITYDTIGNPLSDGTWTYTWEHGRQLASMTDGTGTWNYTYNSDGMRTLRAYGKLTYEYVYNGSQLTQMVMANMATRVLKTLSFAYDANGIPMTVTYDGTVYYYATNVQGDIVAILNSSGTAVVTYTYDAWGNILSTGGTLASSLGTTNPLRYRGYVYDEETELYYLRSRYYDPVAGRFLNADALVSTNQGLVSNNMFTYCLNNPVIFVDDSGMNSQLSKGISFKESVSFFGGGGGGAVGVVVILGVVGGITLGQQIYDIISDVREASKEIYAYSRMIRKELKARKENRPQVHHIVPVGNFSSRSPETIAQIKQMHEMLKNAGINRFLDPNNLMLVSAKTHARLHTNEYIAHIYSLMMATDGSQEEIYAVLFALRLEIAAWDSTAIGY